jgi:cell wall assembly regulator SMI1
MNFLPLLEEKYPPATPADIESLESKIGGRFPDDYREFLLQSDGGRFARNSVRLANLGDETVLNALNRVGDDPRYRIASDYDLFRMVDRIARLSIPFGDDPGGNRFLISVEPETYGAVFFWDHENEPVEGGNSIAQFPNLHRLANSFEEFILSLE